MKHEQHQVHCNPEKIGAAYLKNKDGEVAKSSVCLFGTLFYDRVRPPMDGAGILAPVTLDNPIAGSNTLMEHKTVY